MTTKFEQIGQLAAQRVATCKARVRARATYMVHDLEVALRAHPDALVLVEQLSPHLSKLGASEWAEVPPAAGDMVQHQLRAWQTTLDIWQHTKDESDGDELECFLDALREELEPTRDDLLQALSACTEIRSTLVTSDPLSPWPFEESCSARDLARQANAAAATALEVPASTLPTPEQLLPEDIGIVMLAERVSFAGLLPNLLDEQQAWAEVLSALPAITGP